MHAWIVIAWVEMTGAEFTGRTLDRYGLERETRAAPVAKALVWIRDGGAQDLENAKAHAARDGHTVITYDRTEREPLDAARRAVLAQHKVTPWTH